MSALGLKQFDASMHKTNEWLRDVALEMDWDDDRGMAYFALRSVLHALRDRLSVQEAVDFAAQLPMIVRGFYYEGWQPSKGPICDRKVEDFLGRVQAHYPHDEWQDVEQITRAVFRVIAKHVTGGEIEDVQRCLPEELRQLWPQKCNS